MDEAPIRKEMDNLKKLVEVAKSYGKPLRVAVRAVGLRLVG